MQSFYVDNLSVLLNETRGFHSLQDNAVTCNCYPLAVYLMDFITSFGTIKSQLGKHSPSSLSYWPEFFISFCQVDFENIPCL